MHAEILAMARRHSLAGATRGPAPRQELRTTGTGSNPTAPPARMLNVSKLREHRTLRTTTSETRKPAPVQRFPARDWRHSCTARVSPGDRRRSMTLARVFWASVSSGIGLPRAHARTGTKMLEPMPLLEPLQGKQGPCPVLHQQLSAHPQPALAGMRIQGRCASMSRRGRCFEEGPPVLLGQAPLWVTLDVRHNPRGLLYALT